MTRKLLCISVGILMALAAYAQAPNFDYPFMMSCPEGMIVENNYYDIPTFGDWDDDGDQDMLLGVFYSGNIFYYQNTAGAGAPPVLANHTVLQADGVNISVTYG